MAGWFELSTTSNGQFRFVLKAGNAETILTSELYKAKSSAENGIASIQANSALEERYEKKESTNGRFYFNLKAGNHQIIGTSQMYTTALSRDAGIASVQANGASTTIKDCSNIRDKYLVLNFEVNNDSPYEVVALEIANLCKAVNAYHIACGGTGLVIDDWETFVKTKQLVGV
jgi:uncharacterized protein